MGVQKVHKKRTKEGTDGGRGRGKEDLAVGDRLDGVAGIIHKHLRGSISPVAQESGAAVVAALACVMIASACDRISMRLM